MNKTTSMPSMHSYEKYTRGGVLLGNGKITLGISGYLTYEKAQEIRKRVEVGGPWNRYL